MKAKQLLYSGKVWWEERLTNLANRPRFAKLKPSKLVLTINNLLVDLLICQTFFRQMLEMSQFTKFSLAKLSCYTVYCIHSNLNFRESWLQEIVKTSI